MDFDGAPDMSSIDPDLPPDADAFDLGPDGGADAPAPATSAPPAPPSPAPVPPPPVARPASLPSPAGSPHAAGAVVVLAAMGALAGATAHGPLGAAAGAAVVGAGMNLWRAARMLPGGGPAEREEAAWAGASGAVGLAVAGYLGWRIYRGRDG